MTEKLELSSSTVEWILCKMESLSKAVMNNQFVEDAHTISEKLGQFRAYKELLDNAGYESYGLEIKIKLPTMTEYSKSS